MVLHFARAEFFNVGIGLGSTPFWKTFNRIKHFKPIQGFTLIGNTKSGAVVGPEGVTEIERNGAHYYSTFLADFGKPSSSDGNIDVVKKQRVAADSLPCFANGIAVLLASGALHSQEGLVSSCWCSSGLDRKRSRYLRNRIKPPIDFGWGMATILKVDKYPSLIGEICRIDKFCQYAIFSAQNNRGALGYFQRLLGQCVAFYHLTQLASVDYSNNRPDEDCSTLEQHGSIFVPVLLTLFGGCIYMYGWGKIENSSYGLIIFLCGLVICVYGIYGVVMRGIVCR